MIGLWPWQICFPCVCSSGSLMTNTTNRMFFAEMEEIFFVFQLRKSSIIFYSSSFIEITNDKVLSFFTLLQLCNSFTRLSKHSTTFMTNSFLQNRLIIRFSFWWEREKLLRFCLQFCRITTMMPFICTFFSCHFKLKLVFVNIKRIICTSVTSMVEIFSLVLKWNFPCFIGEND